MMYQSNQYIPEAARLEDYLQAIRLRKWLVLALTLLGLLGAFLFATSRQPTYTAETTVLLRGSPSESRIPGQDAAPNLEREREILLSNEVAERVLGALSIDASPEDLRTNLEVEFRPDSDVLNVNYTSSAANSAALTANTFAQEYVSLREGQATAYLGSLAESLTTDIEELQTALADNSARLAELWDERGDVVAADGNPADLDAAIAVETSSASSLTNQLRNAEAELRSVEQKQNSRLPAAEILRGATAPASPDGIGLPILMTAGLLLGLIAGVVAAFLLERLDTTARDDEDVAAALGTSVIGAVPTLGLGSRVGTGSLIMLSSGGSARFAAAREAFRRLRSSVQFLNSSSGVSSIIVTSSAPAEGKSLTAANLAIALAQNGSRVVIVSADLRRPTLERMFAMEAARHGLSDYLAHAAELNAEKVPGIDNLWLIRSGTPPDNPGELLSSDRFEQMIKELERENVEYIVIDTPPVLSTADALSAARFVDGVIVVVDTERTETADLLQVKTDLERSGSKLLGAVMNRQRFERGGLFRRDRYAYHQATG